MKTVQKHYMEDAKTKDWMDKNLSPTKQSEFIREATKEKIEAIKNSKKVV